MTTAFCAGWPEPMVLLAGARSWSAGFAADEAAVELLACLAADVPELLGPALEGYAPWLRPCARPGWWYLDGQALAEALELFRRPLQPVLRVIAALATDGAALDLGVTLAAVPRGWLGPVFAALGHAAGCPGLRLVPADGAEPGLFSWLETTAGVPLPAVRNNSVQGSYLVPDVPAVPEAPDTARVPALGRGHRVG